jgi:hypothetical protein
MWLAPQAQEPQVLASMGRQVTRARPNAAAARVCYMLGDYRRRARKILAFPASDLRADLDDNPLAKRAILTRLDILLEELAQVREFVEGRAKNFRGARVPEER